MPRLKYILFACFCSAVIFGVFGCSPASDTMPSFDQTNAFNLLKKQVEFGPRYPGASGHDQARDYLVSQLKQYADSVTLQDFSHNINGNQIKMQNITAVFNPKAKNWILLCAHWDTRPTADQEVLAAKKKQPIPGANDGASGVAVLLEMARMFAKQKPDVGIYMVLFDGEDYGPSGANMFLGSAYFAQNLDKCAVVDGKPVKFKYGILLDMVGDKDLGIYQEDQSSQAAPNVVKKVWDTAKALGYEEQFPSEGSQSIMDDHVPLIRAGVKCIDIIDFDYGPWHTLDDTVDKCSPKSLKIVGDVIAHVVYSEKSSQ